MEGQRVLEVFYGFLFELTRGNLERLHVGMMKGQEGRMRVNRTITSEHF